MMTRIISPSQVLCDAAGIAPEGSPAKSAGICALCGTPHEKGDCISAFAMKDSFTNWSALAAPESPWVCGYCQATLASTRMKAFQCLVASCDGVFRALANNEIAHVLLNPPPPPFIVHLGMVGKSSHVTWRTPVSMSRDVFFVRDGELSLKINMPRVLRGLQADRELMALYVENQTAEAEKALNEAANAHNEVGKAKKGKKAAKPKAVSKTKPLRSCVYLTPGFANGRNGETLDEIRWYVAREYTNGNGIPARLLQKIQTLSPGDLWAMQRIVYAEDPCLGSPIEG